MDDGVEDLVTVLDLRGEPWSLYRGMGKDWVVQLGVVQQGTERAVHGSTIRDALKSAVASLPVPLIPPRPVLTDWNKPVKEGPRWVTREVGGGAWFDSKTKRDALAALRSQALHYLAKAAEWDAEYGVLVTTGIEGVDFRHR